MDKHCARAQYTGANDVTNAKLQTEIHAMCLPLARFVAIFAHHMKLDGYNIVDFTSQLADFNTVHRHLLKGLTAVRAHVDSCGL